MRLPDYAGCTARAWEPRGDFRTKPAHEASLRCVVVEGPFHPIWQRWMLGLCHLRTIDGAPPARKQYPEAEYEIVVAAINPEKPFDPDKPPYSLLTPVDQVVQFHGVDDDRAKAIFAELLDAILQGTLSPDQDYREFWKEIVRVKTEECYG